MTLLHSTYGKGRVRMMRLSGEGQNRVFTATDKPHGQIECTVGRGSWPPGIPCRIYRLWVATPWSHAFRGVADAVRDTTGPMLLEIPWICRLIAFSAPCRSWASMDAMTARCSDE